MKFEELTSSNKVKQSLVELILEISRDFDNLTEHSSVKSKFDKLNQYKNLGDWAEEYWNFDMTPYDNVVNKIIPENSTFYGFLEKD